MRKVKTALFELLLVGSVLGILAILFYVVCSLTANGVAGAI